MPKRNLEPKGFSIRKFLAVLILPLAFAAVFAYSKPAAADVNDFTITNFKADYYLTNQDPQGQMKVVEKINVLFTDSNHGILRALPNTYKNHPLQVHVDSITSATGAPSKFTSKISNGNLVLRIGDANKYVTGAQEYTITYTEQDVIGFYKDHDELYWDVNGDQWPEPFTSVLATIHLPHGLNLSGQTPVCYTGSFGSREHQCDISVQPNEIRSNALNLAPKQTLTIVAGFQKGYFQPYGSSDVAKDIVKEYHRPLIEFFAPFVLLVGGACILWMWKGRDPRGRGTIIPEYDVPDGLKPIEVGALMDFAVDNRDITATIIDLAIRKYLKIIETDSKKMLVMKKKAYTLHLLNKDWGDLDEWEMSILGALFGSTGDIESIELSSSAHKLYTTAESLRKRINVALTTLGYFTPSPSKKITWPITGLVIFAWIIFSAPRAFPLAFDAGFVIGIILAGVFYHNLSARTSKGVAAKEHILGLKMYMEVAEKDRIKMLQGPDAKYAEKTDAPQQTVNLFEKLLPYAIILKVETEWANKFENIYSSPPSWYAGNYTAFNAGYLVGSLNSGFAPAVNNSFSAPGSSGGSGFGGGGGAGGGGGGGGGGGW